MGELGSFPYSRRELAFSLYSFPAPSWLPAIEPSVAIDGTAGTGGSRRLDATARGAPLCPHPSGLHVRAVDA